MIRVFGCFACEEGLLVSMSPRVILDSWAPTFSAGIHAFLLVFHGLCKLTANTRKLKLSVLSEPDPPLCCCTATFAPHQRLGSRGKQLWVSPPCTAAMFERVDTNIIISTTNSVVATLTPGVRFPDSNVSNLRCGKLLDTWNIETWRP